MQTDPACTPASPDTLMLSTPKESSRGRPHLDQVADHSDGAGDRKAGQQEAPLVPPDDSGVPGGGFLQRHPRQVLPLFAQVIGSVGDGGGAPSRISAGCLQTWGG